MKIQESSHTYKLLYNEIIGELLTVILDEFDECCVRGKEIPFVLEKKFTEYRKKAYVNMSNPRLDRHKLASCICGAIIEINPISGLKGGKIPKRINEIFALYVGLAVIKHYMIYDTLRNLDIPFDTKNKMKMYLIKNFDMSLPSIDDNICDTQEYQKNLSNALHWTHHVCELNDKVCYHYDIWAYAKIFYHLELYNKEKFDIVCKTYLREHMV